jgi:hypothetical protein
VPLAAVVAENGAVALIPKPASWHRVRRQRARARRQAGRLAARRERIVREVPGATLSRDSVGRVTDIAIDHAEFAHLDEATIAQVVALMRAEGMTATVSSIHINGWSARTRSSRGALGRCSACSARSSTASATAAYVGDSTTTSRCSPRSRFRSASPTSADFADALRWPTYVTALDRGRGFARSPRRCSRRAVAEPLGRPSAAPDEGASSPKNSAAARARRRSR